MDYPKQLISSLIEQVDKRIKNFYDLESSKYLPDDTFSNIIVKTL